MFDDSSQRAALLQILRGFCLQPTVDPVVAMLDDAVAEHFADLLEGLLCLLTRLSHGAIVSRAIGHVALDLRPQQLDRLHLGAEGRSEHE